MGEGKSSLARVLVIIVFLVLLIVILVLACIYGTRLNCDAADKLNDKYRLESKPTMTHFPQIMSMNMDALEHVQKPGAKAFMKTISHSLVAAKEMNGAILKLEPSKPIEYFQWYEALVAVLAGSVNITDASGQTFTAIAGDNMYIRAMTFVTYSAVTTSYIYHVVQPADPYTGIDAQDLIVTGGYKQLQIVRSENFFTAKPNIPWFNNTDNSLSYLNDTIFSNVTGKEMVGGLYKLLKGPALEYTYTYEEFKYIVEGEFHLTDGQGKFVKAKAGDLMYFPKGTYVHFTSPDYALGFFVGQRVPGAA